MNACLDRSEREHLIAFIVIELGAAGRPQAVLELIDKNVDLKNNLINLNAAGKVHLRKRRPVARAADSAACSPLGVGYRTQAYQVSRADRGTQPDPWWTCPFRAGYAIGENRLNRRMRRSGGVGATPKTLRHTMLTWLARRGVPNEQRMALAWHAAQDTTARNYEHLSPDYLVAAIREVDTFFEALYEHTSAHLRYADNCVTGRPTSKKAVFE